MQIDANGCKCESPAEELERYAQRRTQGYRTYGGSYSWAPVIGTAQSAPVEYLDKLCMIGYLASKDLTPVVQTMDSAIRRINHYLLDNSIGFASVSPVDSDLSSG